MIYVYETFAITVPASAAGPEQSIQGHILGGEQMQGGKLFPRGYTFRALIELLKGTEAVQLHGSTFAVKQNFRTDPNTGAVETRAYHPVKRSDSRRFWQAWRYANGQQNTH